MNSFKKLGFDLISKTYGGTDVLISKQPLPVEQLIALYEKENPLEESEHKTWRHFYVWGPQLGELQITPQEGETFAGVIKRAVGKKQWPTHFFMMSFVNPDVTTEIYSLSKEQTKQIFG
jgi:hypothetical protein